jgi:hypothetical protein
MASATVRVARRIGFSTAGWDAVMVALAAAHGVVLLAAPGAPLIALLFWWNANTISHNFIHVRFFRWRAANRFFAVYLSVLLGFPHQLWRDRHLAHHAEARTRVRPTRDLLVQTGLVSLLWIVMADRAPNFLLTSYLPGFADGLALCALHGYFEHARGTTSYYGRLYNFLFFNDGYHVEHHAHPGAHWSRLPECAAPHDDGGSVSTWPAPVRWMELFGLEALERLAIRFRPVRRFVVRTHARALADVISCIPPVHRVAIVGGGLFPRTAIILRELLPAARITIIDASRANVECARCVIEGETLGPTYEDIEYVHGRYPEVDVERFDLVVFPLSFDGMRDDLYAHPPAQAVIVHDWVWRRRGTSRIVSFALLKRLNLLVSSVSPGSSVAESYLPAGHP